MNSIIAERRVRTALSKEVPPAADIVYQIGEELLFHSEKEKEWIGPFIVTGISGRMITIISSESSNEPKKEILVNKFQIKPFFQEVNFMHNILQFRTKQSEMTKPLYRAFITEVIYPEDPRTDKFGPAKKKELEGLIKRGTWKVVLKEEVPDDANILGSRFVLTIKDTGNEIEIWKARFVVQGHREKMKNSLVHDIATIKNKSVRLLIALAAIFGFRLFSTDISQSYLKSAEALIRDV